MHHACHHFLWEVPGAVESVECERAEWHQLLLQHTLALRCTNLQVRRPRATDDPPWPAATTTPRERRAKGLASDAISATMLQCAPAKVGKFGFKRLAECASMALAGLRCGWHAVPRAARPLLCSRAKSYVMPLARAYILFRCKCTHCEYERSQSARVGVCSCVLVALPACCTGQRR
jgi:hypothetical protein